MLTQGMNRKISSSNTVVLDESVDAYPVLQIKNKYCTASVALHGAHLFHWHPLGEEPVIYTSPSAVYKLGKAIRGGIPVCWPWFNKHPTNSSLPSHGFVRNKFWDLTAIEETAMSTTLVFSLSSNSETRKLWEAVFEVSLRITVGEKLECSLTSKNTASSNAGFTPSNSLSIGGALHTYLSVGSIDAVEISGLEEVSYIDTVGTEAVRTQLGRVTISEEVDRIYTGTTTDIILHDKLLKRKLRVSRKGSQSAVIWNPWIEKAKELADLPDDGYKNFVCIESANARGDVYLLQPGESHTLSTNVTIE